MGAWPEREAPAGKSHFGAFLGGKGEGFVLPLFFRTRVPLKVVGGLRTDATR